MNCDLLKMSKDEQEILKIQYEKLIKARNFHYEHFNKWLMSFYVIIGALFVALYKIHTEPPIHVHMELCVAIVGYIVSVATLLSGKGYYYWETNWILLVHKFEKTYLKEENDIFKSRVYSVMADKNANNSICNPIMGANISTSKVALAITWFITVLWGMIAIYFVIKMLYVDCLHSMCCRVIVSVLASIVSTQILLYIGGILFPSDLHNLDELKQ